MPQIPPKINPNGKNGFAIPDTAAEIAAFTLEMSTQYKNRGRKTKKFDLVGASRTSSGGKGPSRKDTIVPTIALSSPLNGTVYPSDTVSVNIQASASDNVGVTSMSLYVNGAVVKNQSFTAQAGVTRDISYIYTFPASGVYNVSASAKDKAGNTVTIGVTVTKETPIIVVDPPPTPLPSSVELVTPVPGNQGGEGSCAAWAVATQRSIEEYYVTNASSYSTSTNIFSPEFIYDMVRLIEYNQHGYQFSCGSGSGVASNLGILQNYGCCLWDTLPYSSAGQGCQTTDTTYPCGSPTGAPCPPCNPCVLTSEVMAEALTKKITGGRSILATDITAIKQKLADKHPLSFPFLMDSNFYNSTCGFIWNSPGSPMFSHALVLVGYDDAKHAYKAINSWGTSWGCNGYVWIDYDFFATSIGTGYVYYIVY